ncbi:otoferlin [Topomyia yanbarensis]|uniref:otoferlin n=1 Tax=Topomyia yanbarensis TaxID=2498891 RepID=UPI00273CBB42|nr:otoferlin [Topomyia yanbarensis]
MDLSIVSCHQRSIPMEFPTADSDIIEDNLLAPLTDHQSLQRVKYSISIFRGDFKLKSDYAVQVSFGGIVARTKTAQNSTTNEWNEKLAFVGTFPSLSQMFVFDIVISECCHRRSLAFVELPFFKLSKQIDSVYTLPTFGPSYLYFYHGHQNSKYTGRVLLSISTEILHNRSDSPRKCHSTSISTSLDTAAYWTEECFLMKLVILNVLVFDASKPTKIKITLSCIGKDSNTAELTMDELPLSKVHLASFNELVQHQRPVLTVKYQCPDFRWKLQTMMGLHHAWILCKDLLAKYDLFRMDCGTDNSDVLKTATAALLIDIDENLKKSAKIIYTKSDKRSTDWDHKWVLHVTEQIDNLTASTEHLKLSIKQVSTPDEIQSIHSKLIILLESLKKITHDDQNTFPECLLFIRHSKGRGSCKQTTAKGCIPSCSKTHPDALCRLNTIDYMHNPAASSNTSTKVATDMQCPKRCSLLLRPFRCQHSCGPEWCGCVYAKLDAAVWVGTEQDAAEWDKQQKSAPLFNNQDIVQCHQSPHPMKCTVNVHQAKIQAGFDTSGLSDPKLVVLFENVEMVTSVIPRTLSPVWNEIIEFRNVRLIEYNDCFMSTDFSVMLILLDEDKRMCFQRTDEIIGIGWAQVAIIQNSTTSDNGDIINKGVHRNPACTALSLRDESLIADNKQGVKTFPKVLQQKDGEKSATDLWMRFNNRRDSVLRWIGVFRNGQHTADILMSIQITQMEHCDAKKVIINLIPGIPKSIRPITSMFNIEVLFGGLRGFDKCKLANVGRFRVQITLGELKLMSGLSSRSFGQSINFLDSYTKGSLMLPTKLEYWPPLIIHLIDCSRINVDRVVAANIIETPKSFLLTENSALIQNYLVCNTGTDHIMETTPIDAFSNPEEHPLIEISGRKSSLTNKIRPALLTIKGIVEAKLKLAADKRKHSENDTYRRGSLEAEYTWWTKFYNSCSSQPSDYKHKLKIYPCELEKIAEFEQFQDWCTTMQLFKKTSQNPLKLTKPYCSIKCKVWIKASSGGILPTQQSNPLSNMFLRSLPALSTETQIMVVVYVIQGLNLRSRDIFSLSDAYIKLEYGKEKIVDRPNYVKDRSKPVFGRRFVLHGRLPRDQIMKISVVDRDTCSSDDLIGATTIDIEDRYRSRHFVSMGVPEEFNCTGYNSWRHPLKPSALLEQICINSGLIAPKYVGNVIQLAGITFHDDSTISITENLRERLALNVLKNFHRIPVLGCHIVPEHVETRSLFHPDHPGIEQGKLQLWIEIFPAESVPTLVNITPNPPKPYELRVIVWNTLDVILDEKNIFGTKMSDIYVKSWLQDVEESQFTDIHYRSLDGAGNFNWRMVFPLNYSTAETMMVVTRKKTFYEQLDTEEKVPPLLTVQVWDNDLFSRDDFLGTMSLNLAHLPRPVTNPQKCIIEPTTTTKHPYVNLFRVDKIRGWFPIVGKKDNKIVQTGKVDLELEILTEEEALLRPAGRGRKPPQSLPVPDRPDASFNWYRSPLKSFRLILWPCARKVLIVGFVIALIALACYAVITALPASFVTNVFARKASLDRTVRTGAEEE